MTDIRRLIKNRFVLGTIISAMVLVLFALLVTGLSITGKPDRLFPFIGSSYEGLADGEKIKGWANFDKDSYLIGEIARYTVRLHWDSAKLTPDIETFKNGIGFFPFNRREIFEQQSVVERNIHEYILEITLQAVDVELTSSYTLAPPTVYFTSTDNGEDGLQSYRIVAPEVHIGSYYPPDVSKIFLQEIKGEIDDPIFLRQGIMFFLGCLLLLLATIMIWYFGRVRQLESLSQAEKLWREFHRINKESMDNRDYLVRCELIFTNLLMSRIEMSPVNFWSGKEPEDAHWKYTVNQAREIFYKSYLLDQPESTVVTEIDNLLNQLFSQLVEEDQLKIEQVPLLSTRLLRQPAMLSVSAVLVIFSLLIFILATQPLVWSSGDIVEYNRTMQLLQSDEAVENKYEQILNLVERVDDEKIKAAALFNAGTFATTPELTGQDKYQQLALLEVMFQEQKVFLDALLHSMNMEDPFLMIAIIRDGIRFLTQGQAALKAAVRIAPDDEAIRRNLELIQKRRQAYAETIQELLQGGEDTSAMGELQRQSLMDLEQFMQMEMPEEFAELEEGKDDKDYFILEGF
ncbi:MAG: hypothetical protein ACI9XC_001390 [Gammaproteobacteria bacterium]